jgi:hypothetical protein
MAFKLSNTHEKKKFKSNISRMKKRLDKYFIYLTKDDSNTNDIHNKII